MTSVIDLPPPPPTICRVLVMNKEQKKHYKAPETPEERYAANNEDAVIVDCGVLYKPEVSIPEWQKDPIPAEFDFAGPPAGGAKVVPRPISLCELKKTFYDVTTGDILLNGKKDIGADSSVLSKTSWNAVASYLQDNWRVFKSGLPANCENTIVQTYQVDLCKTPDKWDPKFYMDVLENASTCALWDKDGLCPITDIETNLYKDLTEKLAVSRGSMKGYTNQYDETPLRWKSAFLGGNGILNGDRLVYSRRLVPMMKGLRPIEFRYWFRVADPVLHELTLESQKYLIKHCNTLQKEQLRGIFDLSFVVLDESTFRYSRVELDKIINKELEILQALYKGDNNINKEAAQDFFMRFVYNLEAVEANLDNWKDMVLIYKDPDEEFDLGEYDFNNLKNDLREILKIFNKNSRIDIVLATLRENLYELLKVDVLLRLYSYLLAKQELGDVTVTQQRFNGITGYTFLTQNNLSVPAQYLYASEHFIIESVYVRDYVEVLYQVGLDDRF